MRRGCFEVRLVRSDEAGSVRSVLGMCQAAARSSIGLDILNRLQALDTLDNRGILDSPDLVGMHSNPGMSYCLARKGDGRSGVI